MIFADRSMNVKRESDKNYLINAELHISNFIKLNNIEYIFSEFTHEILINLINKTRVKL